MSEAVKQDINGPEKQYRLIEMKSGIDQTVVALKDEEEGWTITEMPRLAWHGMTGRQMESKGDVIWL